MTDSPFASARFLLDATFRSASRRSLMLLSYILVVGMALSSGITVLPLHAQPPTNGLEAHWPFTGNANDASGNGHAGTVFGAALVPDRFLNQNSAYSFDGVNDYIRVPHSEALNRDS